MSQFIATDFTFAGTAIDPGLVRSYLFCEKISYPITVKQLVATNERRTLLSCAEVFELNFRRYLALARKTLHVTLGDVRRFVYLNPQAAPTMIRMIIAKIRAHFLQNEWYELMPRFEKATNKIERILNQSTHETYV